jgi:small subunit ribosomal protein S17
MTKEPTTRKRRAAVAPQVEESQPTGSIIKSKTGHVVSDKMNKSIVVRIDMLSPHPLYKKRVRKSKRFMVHDETNEARTGDLVRIVESVPTSKNKSWRLADIVRPGGSRAVAQGMMQAEVVAEMQQDSERE